MRVAAESFNADLFASQVLRAFEFRLAENTVSHEVFNAANKDQICGALDIGAHIAYRSRHSDFRIPAHGGSCSDG
jgi:hypothetical protein